MIPSCFWPQHWFLFWLQHHFYGTTLYLSPILGLFLENVLYQQQHKNQIRKQAAGYNFQNEAVLEPLTTAMNSTEMFRKNSTIYSYLSFGKISLRFLLSMKLYREYMCLNHFWEKPKNQNEHWKLKIESYLCLSKVFEGTKIGAFSYVSMNSKSTQMTMNILFEYYKFLCHTYCFSMSDLL